MQNKIVNNTEYWKNLVAESIIGRNAFPSDELCQRLSRNAMILDLGCGTGEMAEFLSEKGYQVTGIDINEEAINKNQERSKNVTYVAGDITKTLPFENNFFDAVVISFVLVNIIPISERKKVIKELERILKPEGLVWVNEGVVSNSYHRRYELCKQFLGNDHDFFVFKEGTLSSSIQSHEDLQEAINNNRVARVAHHFGIEELKELFGNFNVLSENAAETTSPQTKSVIKMVTMVFRKKI